MRRKWIWLLVGSAMWLAAGCSPPPSTVQPQAWPTGSPGKATPAPMDIPGETTPAPTGSPGEAMPAATGTVGSTTPHPTPAPPETPAIPFPTQVPILIVTQEPEVGLMTEDEAVALAKSTLAEQLGIGQDEIEVQEVMRVTWPDTSLGCPQKGMVYAQVIMPGYRVLLQVDDEGYDVHAGGGQAIVCEGGGAVSPPAGRDSAAIVRLAELARRDLADRLGIAVEDVTPLGGNIVTWPDTSLGCPQPGVVYEEVEIPGYKLVLEAGGQTYTYHTDHERVVLCEQEE